MRLCIAFESAMRPGPNAEKTGGDEYQSCTTEISLFLGVPVQKINHCKVYVIVNVPTPTNKE